MLGPAFVRAIRHWHPVQRFRSTFAFRIEIELSFDIGIVADLPSSNLSARSNLALGPDSGDMVP